MSALRNPLASAEPVLQRCYIEATDLQPQIPTEKGIIPKLLDRVQPVHTVVPVDIYLPGCPPRGTLFHHYKVDENGLIQKVNLIIATGQNNLAMNRTVAQIAHHFIHGSEIPEGMLNCVEAGIRAFDPCLSCSTHTAGQMPLHTQLLAANGNVINEVWRN